MLRVVLDTNVLVSGTFWSGPSSQIIKLAEQGKITLIVSREILQEYDEIIHSEEIRQKVRHHAERAQAALKLVQLGMFIDPKERIRVVKDDPDDDKFLEASIAGNAKYLINNDKAHRLPLKEFRGIKITPEQFFHRRLYELYKAVVASVC